MATIFCDLWTCFFEHPGLDRSAVAECGGFCLETESLVALCDDFLAYSPVPSDTADIRHEEAGRTTLSLSSFTKILPTES